MNDTQQIAPSADEQRRRRKRKRRWLGVLTVALLLLALLLTPPLINVSRLRKRIAANMSESLGRPVHLDAVTLNLLPVPGFTLQNFVVSEDPAFGSEPVIRANSVRATLRASSLWRRQVEIGTIHFDDPSVNLVRRADGRWNFETILLHAAQEDAAPTAQRKAGPAPRFPYIEATGARVNVKMGDEKLPMALTEADFALWLPSPQRWRLRLSGKPQRTDTSVSDTGTLSIEATLQRASKLENVPIEMTAAWRGSPLGEASKLLTGNDAGWRGNVDATATLRGTLGDAAASGTVKLVGLRRAEFIPAKALDLTTECTGHLSVAVAVLREPTCTVSPAAESHFIFGAGTDAPASALYATADKLDLTGLKATDLRVGTPGVSLNWLLDMARLWTQRIPPEEQATGSASGSFARVAATSGMHAGWQGELHGTIHTGVTDNTKDSAAAMQNFSITSDGTGFVLAPFNLTPAAKTALTLSATANPAGMNLQMSGAASEREMESLQQALPPLVDGFPQAPPTTGKGDATQAVKLNILCTRPWGADQVCATMQPAEPVKKPRHRRR